MFDTKKFTQEKFTPRTHEVAVPDLKKWFKDEEKPVWKVRGLTGKELGRVKEAVSKNKSIAGIIEMLKSSKVTDQTQALESVFNLGSKNTPDNIAERIDQLIAGSIEPKCDTDLAIKLCERFPVEFYSITNKILELTGKGMEPGKPKGSGKQQTSK